MHHGGQQQRKCIFCLLDYIPIEDILQTLDLPKSGMLRLIFKAAFFYAHRIFSVDLRQNGYDYDMGLLDVRPSNF